MQHHSYNKSFHKNAFTLAEVLVTLGIIGVVAAMTMPTLMNSTNHKELEAGLKKAYSALSQAAIFVKEDLGIGLKQRYATYDGTSYPHAEEIANAFYAQLKVAGTCKYKTGSVRNYSKTTNSPYVDLGTPYPTKAVADGMCLDVRVNGGNINISVDVNGTKRPNVLGQDIFFFLIDGNDNLQPKATSRTYTDEELEQMYPNGTLQNYSSQAGNPCSLKSKQAGNGLGCAYYALIDKNPDDSNLGYWVSLK